MTPCSTGGCGSCGNCNNCGGCAGSLVLTEPEIDMLYTLGQLAFLPVARKAEDMTPVYLEDARHTQEEYSTLLQLLEKKNLISIDYNAPLQGADMSAYKGYPVHGSFALTQRGQQILELIETQGFAE